MLVYLRPGPYAPLAAFRSPTATSTISSRSAAATAASAASSSRSRSARRLRDRPRRRVLERLKGKGPTGAAPCSSRCPRASPSRSPKRRRATRFRWAAGYGPLGVGRRHRVQVELPAPGHVLGPRPTSWSSTSGQEGKAASTSSRARRSRRPSITTRPSARSRFRCCTERSKMHGFELITIPVTHRASSRRPRGCRLRHRLRVPVGLGRDELHRHQGSRGDGLPARQDVRRVVVGCRTRRDPRGRGAEGLSRAGAAALLGPRQGARGHPQVRARQGPGHGPAEQVGEVLYTLLHYSAMLAVEGLRKARAATARSR